MHCQRQNYLARNPNDPNLTNPLYGDIRHISKLGEKSRIQISVFKIVVPQKTTENEP